IAWAMIADDVRECLGILTGSNKALIIIAHVYMQTKRVRGGGEVSTATFNVSGKSRQYVAGLANQILHFDVVPDLEHDAKRDKHVVIASAQSGVQAGDQWGLFPDELDLGDSPEEGAEAILTAFGMLEDE
ncbi:MAG: hypothetical protein KKD77_20195, partial [Gammaproteobacteria bacterium]|nr:hypothetical protein [Gammaproteobacteria bacterium]